jgi:hypothetical protein
MPVPLLKSGRRYRVLQDLGDLRTGRELDLLLAEYSFVPYSGMGGWQLLFTDLELPLEESQHASIIAGIHDYFRDIGPFDWRAHAERYARLIRERSAPPEDGDRAEGERRAAALDREIEAVLREQPSSPDPMSPKKAYRLAAKRLRARGEPVD